MQIDMRACGTHGWGCQGCWGRLGPWWQFSSSWGRCDRRPAFFFQAERAQSGGPSRSGNAAHSCAFNFQGRGKETSGAMRISHGLSIAASSGGGVRLQAVAEAQPLRQAHLPVAVAVHVRERIEAALASQY